MFSNYNKDHSALYNKLVNLSRNIFFYSKGNLPDTAETRIYLIFFHFSIILRVFKIKTYIQFPQEIYDNIFQNIEYHLRELGVGDVGVNKKMKILNKYFYDILVNIDINQHEDLTNFEFNTNLINHYFDSKTHLADENLEFLRTYFNDFYKICFDLKRQNMIEGDLNT